MPDETPSHDLAGQHPALAGAPGGAQAPDTLGGDSARCGGEHGIREGAGAGGEDSRDCFASLTLAGRPESGSDGLARLGSRPSNATRYLETSRGILSYTQLAPLFGERVALSSNSPRKPKPVAPNTSPRWKLPTVATGSRSWTSGATASPTPKRRKLEQFFDHQKP